jgi:hypothetical protein
MGLGINREEREGARRGIYLWDWGLTARNARVREGGGFLTARNAEGLRWDLTQIMQMHNLG